MVHRPSDSRLLVNLLDHEKDYSKQLSTLLDKSQSSLASFSAYASASAPPTSQIIIQVAGALAGADEALRKYATSLEQWQEQLKSLKALEDGVGNVMRDREILCVVHNLNNNSLLNPSQRDPPYQAFQIPETNEGLYPRFLVDIDTHETSRSTNVDETRRCAVRVAGMRGPPRDQRARARRHAQHSLRVWAERTLQGSRGMRMDVG